MFRSLKLKHFRGFKELNIEQFDQFNLIIGRNNVGKTAFLESLFLLLGPTNPQLPITISMFRGIAEFRGSADELWGWLFNRKETKTPITLLARTESGATRELKMTIGDPEKIPLVKGKSKRDPEQTSMASATTESGGAELIMQLSHESGKNIRTRVFLGEGGLGIERSASLEAPTSVFVSARAGYSNDNPTRFSDLEATGQENAIVPALQILEPRLKRLTVLVTGAGPMIHGDLGIGRLVPLPMMGDGMGRLLTLLLAISTSRNGQTLIDDVDTGLHYSVMPKVWTAIAQVARDANVQLFMTTHNWECIRAAHESFSSGKKYDLSIQRLDRTNGDIAAVRFDREMIEKALEAGLELR